ncbi:MULTISPECIES: sulfurtransferase complex subunit TusC [Halomonadaceae]|jgi:tRNA 2-thiouridine synthesizing protein C|uniref:Intracellular sulfur oxidation protein DsrF n=1 Tax=Vreelandella titanicae TaxID=664683 RepID=A0A653RKM6_9GAMM|nr:MULTISPECIES: sulfurtransferase complex subunit TusC [Halomonas]UEQ06460.1 sulfurtransferase complex subunit TusC [Halomonas profundus]KIN12816.1 multidrug transporter [Halomonas sp. KHS3]MCE7517208.1 sulfurtransferase complex subunit TusC [Halomonas titanicae]QKS23514.1 Intracellular sulfur oxidation protein DsrF [Halomonas titanicae]QNU61405.1 sulfurtransferase complex subunit TusC [Halomonas titanicae]|tara:strand:+ start:689 stop:1054 length:366 start_codon:yes stop_codon:yes gene_type:complete
MATPDALLVIIRHAPHSSNWLREGLDAALVAAAFGQPVHLLFMGQGIMALLKEQGSGAPGQKATLPTIDMLEMYDIDKLWVTEEALQGMHLSADSLVEGITLIADQEIPGLLQQHTQILNF